MNTLVRYMEQNDLSEQVLSSLCSIDPERIELWMTLDNIELTMSMSTKEFSIISALFQMMHADNTFAEDMIEDTVQQLKDEEVTK